jgi:hypothetical protein
MQLRPHMYETALRYSLSKETELRQMLEDCNNHIIVLSLLPSKESKYL